MPNPSKPTELKRLTGNPGKRPLACDAKRGRGAHHVRDADRLMRWSARDLYIPEQQIQGHEGALPHEPGKLWQDVVGSGRIATADEKSATFSQSRSEARLPHPPVQQRRHVAVDAPRLAKSARR